MHVFELIMLICFGLSWPISVYKSIRYKSTRNKSAVFLTFIIVGYIAGILNKVVNSDYSYVLFFYAFNLTVVTLDLCLFMVNRHRERAARAESPAD